MQFEFATAARILFGPGQVRELPAAAKALGRRALLVTGRTPDRWSSLVRDLDTVTLPVTGEPSLDTVRGGVERARAERCDFVLAIGGGSAIDAGKAIAALAPNSGEPLDYLEVIGRGAALAEPPLPFLAIPTTAGTGSEVTRNAVLGSVEHRVKASLRSPAMLPRMAIVDPELTLGLPPAITASTGLDALTQLIEPYLGCRATPITDALCLDGISRVAGSLRRACTHGNDLAARTEMAMASLYGGIALANAGLGAVHGFAAPIGGMFEAPHGAVCAALLPHAMQTNLRALRERAGGCDTLRRFAKVAALLTGNGQAVADDGIDWLHALCVDFEIPPLRAYGIAVEHIPGIVEKAARASSMKGNPIQLTTHELSTILEHAV